MDTKTSDQLSWYIKNGDSRRIRFSFFKKPIKPLIVPYPITQLCNGISINGKTIKSILFSTDMAIIENSDADAVLAVYPFTPSLRIIKNLIDFSGKPVICGVGGGMTQGKISLQTAIEAEQAGAFALIVNQPFKNKHIEQIKKVVQIPVISSVSTMDFSFSERINAGTDIFNVTGGVNTREIIERINYVTPGASVMATGGKNLESITAVIEAGADAIVLTPPTPGELFKDIMARYRKGLNYK
jgi:ABC-type branched-subunit amino acid transport system substrate-binding protein